MLNRVSPDHAAADEGIPRVRYAAYDCPWCWRVFFPQTPFPKGENSHICKGHYTWLLGLLRNFYTTRQEGERHV